MRKSVKVTLFWAILSSVFLGTVVGMVVGLRVYDDDQRRNVDSMQTVVYAADKYESDVPPPVWYEPEDLGIFQIYNHGEVDPSVISVAVVNEPFPLQSVQPVFKYKDNYYQISPLWVTFGSTGVSGIVTVARILFIMGLVLGAGWCIILVYYVEERIAKANPVRT